jgi:glycosyltransferase involved in cell wall biosynthesis
VAETLPVEVISIGRTRDADTTMKADLAHQGIEPYYLLAGYPFRALALALAYSLRAPLKALRLLRLSNSFPRVQGSSPIGTWLKAMACAELVRRMRITHIHSHWTLPTDVAWLCSNVIGLPFSFSAHAHDIYEDGPFYAKHGLEFSLGRRIAASTFVATCTERGYDYLCAQPEADPGKVHLIYHGVDIDRLPEPTRTNGTTLRIVGAGRLVYYKGFDRLVRVCGRLRLDGVDFKCQIVGEGSQRSTLETMIAELALQDHVELLGSKQHADLLEILAASDVFVFAGRPEDGQYGLPNVLLEAMACGAATVTTWLPEVHELIDGDNGLVAADDEELLHSIRTLATGTDLRRRLAANGRATIFARFSSRTSMRPLLDLLPHG